MSLVLRDSKKGQNVTEGIMNVFGINPVLQG